MGIILNEGKGLVQVVLESTSYASKALNSLTYSTHRDAGKMCQGGCQNSVRHIVVTRHVQGGFHGLPSKVKGEAEGTVFRLDITCPGMASVSAYGGGVFQSARGENGSRDLVPKRCESLR